MVLPNMQNRSFSQKAEGSLRVGTVSGRADNWFFTQGMTPVRLKRAASCLIEPQLGDTVLIYDAGFENVSFITAVLVSSDETTSKVMLPGGASLENIDQQLTIKAENISLNGKSSVVLNSAHVDVSATVATLKVSHFQSWSESLEAHSVRATFSIKTLTSRVQQSISRIKNSLRKVEGLDETQAGRVRVLVEGHHQLKAEHVTTQAQGFVRIDGKKIDLG